MRRHDAGKPRNGPEEDGRDGDDTGPEEDGLRILTGAGPTPRAGSTLRAGPTPGAGAVPEPGVGAVPRHGGSRDPRTFLDRARVLEAAASGLVFVTGTDTGVGKTVTTAALASLLGAEGLDVHVHKPLQTGLIEPDDPERARLEAAYSDVVVRGDAQIAGELASCFFSTGLALRLPLSPAAAAEAAGVHPPSATEHARRILALREHHDVVLVEGAGGILVDLGGLTLADLARACGIGSFVVVCRPGLGTLNHTDLTVEALASRDLDVAGAVIGTWEDPPRAVDLSNHRALAARHRLLGAVPRGWSGWSGSPMRHPRNGTPAP